MTVKNSDAVENEIPQRAVRRIENERKVWAERYPGGDLQIEIGHMDTEDLYLQSDEAESLREILNELDEDVRSKDAIEAKIDEIRAFDDYPKHNRGHDLRCKHQGWIHALRWVLCSDLVEEP